MASFADQAKSHYFTYPYFAFRRPAELAGGRQLHPVAIVGGGPVGVTAALELARFGVPSVVIEADDTVAEGSRAICFSRRTLEILDALGVAGTVMEKALPWTHGTSYYKDKPVFRLEMPHGEHDKFYPMVNLQQCYLEKFLIDRAAAEPLIEIRWQSRVVGLTKEAEAVTLDIETPEGRYPLRACYVIAADGARSVMRQLLGLSLHGQSYEGRYLIADIVLRSDYPTERRAWFDPPSNPGSTVLMHKQPDDIWRIDYQLRDDEDAEQELQEPRIRQRIADHLSFIGETKPWELDWFSLYKAHSLCLDDYVQERVIFAGDAAHLVPIFGVRGLNSGIADANNLGWKLALVIEGKASPALLRSYGEERLAATFDVFANAGKSTLFMTPPSRGYAVMREAALRLAVDQALTRPLINPRQSQPFYYRESALNTDDRAFASGPPPGALPPGRRLTDGGYLCDLIGRAFTLLAFDDAMRDYLGPWLAAQAGVSLTVLTDDLRADFDAAPASLYLLRPDGHVAARFKARPSLADLEAALKRAQGNA